MMSKSQRMPWIPVDQMTAAQRATAAMLGQVSGGTTSGPQSFLLRSPEMALHLHQLIHYLLGKSPLPRRLAEFAILIQAKLWDQDYEWWAHHHLAIRYGIDPSVPDDLRIGCRPAKMQPDEALVYDFCMELSTTHRVSDATFAAISAALSEQALADLTVVTGTYVTISMILNVAEAVAPADDPLPFGAGNEGNKPG
jgi:4-carboxymuconolactone decarboxylase